MRERGEGWLLATLAAGVAGTCFAIAFWGATGRFGASSDDRWGSARQATVPGLADLPAAAVTTTSTAPAPSGFADGACLVLVRGATGVADVSEVACGEPHHFEVAATVDLDGLPAGYPASEVWALIDENCVSVAETYLGAPLGRDRVPPIAAGAVRIAEPAWQAGARRTPCVVVEVDAAGGPVARTGRLRP
jgi:hypothetical protein